MTSNSKVAQFPIAGQSRRKPHISELDTLNSTSTDPSPKPKREHRGVAPLNPLTFVPPFDVLTELADSRDTYVGDHPLTLYQLPSYLRTCIDRLRARVVTLSTPGVSPTIACCITYGLEVLESQDDVKIIRKLRKQLHLDDKSSAWQIDEIASWFRNFQLSIPDPSASGIKSLNILIPEHLKKELTSFSSDLGVSFSTIATLALMATLHIQPATLREHQEIIAVALEFFLKRVKFRRKVSEALLEVLDK